MIIEISRAKEELNELFELVLDFKSEISSNTIWNMNENVNAPNGIETSSVKWKKFENRSIRTLIYMQNCNLSTTIGIQNKIEELSKKELVTNNEIEYLEFEIDNLLLGLKNQHFAYDEEKRKQELANTVSIKSSIKHKKIFISHSSKDRKYVNEICELLEAIGLGQEQIFCSSVPGYDIRVGENIYDYLRSEFINNDLFVLFVLSDNYYNSVPCLNEMGAAWILKSSHMSVLLPGFNFKDIQGAINPRDIALSIEDKDLSLRLNDFKDRLIDLLNLSVISHTKWERYRQKFVENVSK